MLLSFIRIFFATLFGLVGVLFLLWAIQQHRDLKNTENTEQIRQLLKEHSKKSPGNDQFQKNLDRDHQSAMASINSCYLAAAVFLTSALFVLVIIDEREKVDESKVFSSGKY